MKVLKGNPKKNQNTKKQKTAQASTEEYTLQTSANTVNLRGLDVVEGVEKALSFIDSGLLKGERTVFLIHGHGTSALKSAIRDKLKNDCPYDIRFRAGSPEGRWRWGHGGDIQLEMIISVEIILSD